MTEKNEAEERETGKRNPQTEEIEASQIEGTEPLKQRLPKK